MAQTSQSTPTVTANIGGSNHQVNLRDYLNMRVAPFLKNAITQSLDAAPEFPLQWLGEHLIHQSMLYEGNPDSTQIRERFLYKFEAPAQAHTSPDSAVNGFTQPPSNTGKSESPIPSAPLLDQTGVESSVGQDAEMSNHANGDLGTSQDRETEEPKDTEMTETTETI